MKDENKLNIIDLLQNLNEHFEIWAILDDIPDIVREVCT